MTRTVTLKEGNDGALAVRFHCWCSVSTWSQTWLRHIIQAWSMQFNPHWMLRPLFQEYWAEFAYFGADVVVGEGVCAHTPVVVWVHHSCGRGVMKFYQKLVLWQADRLTFWQDICVSLCLVLLLMWGIRCVCLVLGAICSSAMTFFL